MITLERVSERTFEQLMDMELPPEQDKFVAPNIYSLAQAWLYYENARPFAICEDGAPVGFLMLDWDEDERTVGLWRFMIAHEQQNKGYGRQALEAFLALARAEGKFDLAHLDYMPGNVVARKLYYSLGFRENGKVEDGEIIMTLPLTDAPKLGHTRADEDDVEEIAAFARDEKAAGGELPAVFADEAALAQAVKNGDVTRLTLMGDTVGIFMDGRLLLGRAHQDRLAEARALLALIAR